MQLDAEINSEDLRDILKSISVVADEGILILSNDGLKCRMVDPANVCMIAINIPKAEFKKYKLESDIEIGLAFYKTLMYIETAKNEVISLQLDGPKLTIKYGDMIYTQTTVVSSALRPSAKMPKLEHDVKIEVPTKTISKNIKACAKVDEYINFEMLNDNFRMWSNGTSTSVSIDIEDPLIHKSNTAMALFTADYLSDILKGLTSTNSICISISTDSPIVFEGTLCKTGTVSYLLAPRIEFD